jgi:CheY-like chemotaxis protein
MMQGDVDVESVEGEGSTFSATMVLQRDQEAGKVLTALDRSLLKGKRALIVDDLEPSLTILASQLAGAGIMPLSADTATTALMMLAQATPTAPFDLLITDYILPEMESEAFTARVKALYPDMPVVMLTALAEKGYAQIFASAGCDAYLTKPVRASQLLDILVMIFEARRSGKHLSMLTPLTVFRKGSVSRTQSSDDNAFLEDAEILLVEDHRANRELGIKLLENFGCSPTAVRNGEEAIDMARARAFDLILMDCQMPEMDGFEASMLLCRMKKQREISDVPIIALTANAMKGDREKCMESGMNDYITKPLRKTTLRNTLMQWLPPKENRVSSHAHHDNA